jgi:hypothetical protein
MRSGDCAVKLPEGETAQVSVPKLCRQLALAPRRGLARYLYEDALNRMEERVTPEAMRLRRQSGLTVRHDSNRNQGCLMPT